MTTQSIARDWAGTASDVCRAVVEFSEETLSVYRSSTRRVAEDVGIEKIATEGGYARRQLFELIQNGADELIERRGRIEVVLTDDALYCANEGRPVTPAGVGAILGSNNSPKSGVEIGRFGLGFKSVLGVSRTPAVYSTSGSFGFDAGRSLQAVRRIVPSADRAAVLRLAEPIDPQVAAAEDAVLTDLMTWAETIVVMPRDTGAVDWLTESMREFPREFLLFSSHVEQLVLDDRTGEGVRRVVELEGAGDATWELHERGDEQSRTAWKLFSTTHSPSDAVKRDGGTMAERPVIPVHWAVPLSRPAPGSLWAFFPTTVQTTLSGVINAPWKLDESRTTLVPGPFNEELLHAAVELVMDNLDAVNRVDDPGYYLELLPGRGRELKGWADEVLSAAIYDAGIGLPSVPDQDGVLQLPAILRVAPDAVSSEAAVTWSEQPTRPVGWVHPAAVRNVTRRSRVERLLDASDALPATVREWLEALLPRKTARASISAIKVASSLVHGPCDNAMRQAKILLTEDGKLVTSVRGTVYLPAAIDVDVDVPLIAADVLEDAEAVAALETLGIVEVSARTVLEALVDRALIAPEASREWHWSQIWDLAQRVSGAEVGAVLLHRQLDASDLFVRSMAGRMARMSNLLLPGDLLAPEDFGSSHRGLLIDKEFHRGHLDVLRKLGATDRPVRAGGTIEEPWLDEYRRLLVQAAISEARNHGARVKAEHYELIPSAPWAGPATALDGLSKAAAARFARELLAVTDDLDPWTLRRNKGRVVEQLVEHPLLWRVRRLGVLPTDRGPRPIGECITPHLKALVGLLPVADISRAASRALDLPDTPSELDSVRVALALEAFEDLDREDAIGAAYTVLREAIAEPPERMRCIVRREAVWMPPSQVCAANSVADLKVLRGTGSPFVRFESEEEAERFVAAWGLQRVSDVVASKIVAVPDGDPEPVVDSYPLLRMILGAVVESVSFLACRELSREVYTAHGSVPEPLDFELRDGVAYHLSSLSEVDRISRLSARLGKPLDRSDALAVIKNAQAVEVQALLREVRAAATDAHRLLLLIGVDGLRSQIPEALVDAVEETEGPLDDLQTAELVLTVFGIEVLREYENALKERGLSAPSTWAGRRPAIRFVVDQLGFPRKYAGFATVKLDDFLDVPGPSPLPELHEFQKRAAKAIRNMIRESSDRRGMLSLPTGAGKTRVAVQALVEAMADGDFSSPVLWIAQTSELCEQAVQSWAEVWRAVGPDRNLRIGRLWGQGHTAESRDDDGDQVVVATIDKLRAACMENADYDWLKSAGCLVVDEAHTSITPSYTRLLRWTGIDRTESHAPLIGLSATPFRGVSVEETDRLAARYGRTRLDDGIFEEEVSIPMLQRERILARVEHQILEGSEQVPLNNVEREHIKTMRQLPPSVLEKIGRDLDRTNRLIESVLSHPPEWPILMFAASVGHAETLAALISRRGRSAAAVSATTPPGVRRHLIGEFRAGRLQTLTNYGVLTQGFDAPSVRALYIARPTYSPNLYQQMIGRGLRGPENGGKEVCLVVDVADNVVAYGLELAFRDFEYLWKS